MAKKDTNHIDTSDVYKATIQLRNVVILVWVTMVAHFVYTTFLTDWWNLL
jgi:hypothetical protein